MGRWQYSVLCGVLACSSTWFRRRTERCLDQLGSYFDLKDRSANQCHAGRIRVDCLFGNINGAIQMLSSMSQSLCTRQTTAYTEYRGIGDAFFHGGFL
ncbi:hypothetical protein DCO48_09180 [Pseudomonas sp. SDI]|nr:hypothetical protein DCO48_09180 [Pseudomonas sp. SDI]